MFSFSLARSLSQSSINQHTLFLFTTVGVCCAAFLAVLTCLWQRRRYRRKQRNVNGGYSLQGGPLDGSLTGGGNNPNGDALLGQVEPLYTNKAHPKNCNTPGFIILPFVGPAIEHCTRA
jgi:hypothetical protein